MILEDTSLNEVKIIKPKVFWDNRGYFFESFNLKKFQDLLHKKIKFVQDNESFSTRGVLRGLHYQTGKMVQGKLVRVIDGKIFDVAVDIRKKSKNYFKWYGVILDSKNKKQLWIPEGFAHGFLTLSARATIAYKTTNYYRKNSEKSLSWNDPNIGIKWPTTNSKIILSEKDSN